VWIFKTKGVTRFARSERIADSSLREAIERAERGGVDADLEATLSSNVWRGRAKAGPAGFG